MLEDLADSMKGYPIAVLVLAIVLLSATGLQILLQFVRPNIGYYCRNHRSGDRTFFIRNLDPRHYRRRFGVIVAGAGLKYVAVHAGPWCQSMPEELPAEAGKLRVRIVFEEVPEDASFAVRAVAVNGEPTIEVDAASPVQSRSFDTELPRISTVAKIRYYSARYLMGFLSLCAVFLLNLRWGGYGVYSGDFVLVGVGVLISLISFALVVPYRGQAAIVGYAGPVDARHYWGDRSVLSPPSRPLPSLPRLEALNLGERVVSTTARDPA
jgi:hypothetical protein